MRIDDDEDEDEDKDEDVLSWADKLRLAHAPHPNTTWTMKK